MAAKTPTVTQENTGSLNQLRAVFSDIDNGDTWASGLDAVYGYWVNVTGGDGTRNSVAVTESSGTFTFETQEANKALTLYVQVKQS